MSNCQPNAMWPNDKCRFDMSLADDQKKEEKSKKKTTFKTVHTHEIRT